MKAYLLSLVLVLFALSLNARPAAPDLAVQQCIANFTFPASGNCVGQGILFTDLSFVNASGNIITWEWDFGDGTIVVINYPSNQNVTHTYTSYATSYMVTLTITGSLGCTDSETKVVNLSPDPIANFSFPLTGNCLGQAVQFTDLSQVNGGGIIVAFNWNFGDGTLPSNLQNPVHIYPAPGAYSVALSVTNENGCQSSVSKVITINPPPVPVLSGPPAACQGSSGNVYSTQTGMTGYLWTVSPGGTITGGGGPGNNSVTIAWNIAGAQSVGVNYTAPTGCTAVSPAVYNVSVTPPPTASITSNGPTNFCAGNTVILTANLSNSYLWSIGATTQSITVSSSGSYSVTVTNGNGCTAASPPTIVTVLPNPVADAGAGQSIGYGASATLFGSATNGSGNYSWHWEPASVLTNPNVQNPVTVSLSSSVQFTLTVTDMQNGCTGNDQVLVSVTGGPLSVDATATPTATCPGNAVQLMAITSGGTGNNSYSWTSAPAGFTSMIYNPVVYPVVSTVFIVNVIDGFANVNDSISVTILPLPAIPGTPAGPDTADLRTVVSSEYYTTGGASATSYAWEINPSGSGTISGTGPSGTVAWNLTYQGTAKVRVKSLNSCGESLWTAE